MPVIFMPIFATYRDTFSSMSASSQALFAPLWPLCKIAFKKVAVFFSEKSRNPDLGPFVLFGFDAVAAITGNILFLSAKDVRSVLAMISLDLAENIVIALRAHFIAEDFEKSVAAKKTATLEHDMMALKKEMATVVVRACKSERELQFIQNHLGISHELVSLGNFKNNGAVVLDSSPSAWSHSDAASSLDEHAAEKLDQFAAADNVRLKLNKAARLLVCLVASESSETM